MRMRMQMFNVHSKNRQEVSLVYCTNQTKRLMGKNKKKTIEQSNISAKAVNYELKGNGEIDLYSAHREKLISEALRYGTRSFYTANMPAFIS